MGIQLGWGGYGTKAEWKLGQGTMVWTRQRSPTVPGVSGPLGLHCVGMCPCLWVCGSQGRREREAPRERAEIMVRALLLCDPG